MDEKWRWQGIPDLILPDREDDASEEAGGPDAPHAPLEMPGAAAMAGMGETGGQAAGAASGAARRSGGSVLTGLPGLPGLSGPPDLLGLPGGADVRGGPVGASGPEHGAMNASWPGQALVEPRLLGPEEIRQAIDPALFFREELPGCDGRTGPEQSLRCVFCGRVTARVDLAAGRFRCPDCPVAGPDDLDVIDFYRLRHDLPYYRSVETLARAVARGRYARRRVVAASGPFFAPSSLAAPGLGPFPDVGTEAGSAEGPDPRSIGWAVPPGSGSRPAQERTGHDRADPEGLTARSRPAGSLAVPSPLADRAVELAALLAPPSAPAVPSPWPDLDQALGGGFFGGRLYGLAGAVGDFAVAAAEHAALAGRRVVLVLAAVSEERFLRSRLGETPAEQALADYLAALGSFLTIIEVPPRTDVGDLIRALGPVPGGLAVGPEFVVLDDPSLLCPGPGRPAPRSEGRAYAPSLFAEVAYRLKALARSTGAAVLAPLGLADSRRCDAVLVRGPDGRVAVRTGEVSR